MGLVEDPLNELFGSHNVLRKGMPIRDLAGFKAYKS